MKRRAVAGMLAFCILAGCMPGCGQMNIPRSIPLSGVTDVAGDDGQRCYDMRADETDDYTFSCDAATSIAVTVGETTVTGTHEVTAAIQKGEDCRVELTAAPGALLEMETTADHATRLPYQPSAWKMTGATASDPASDPLTPAEVFYRGAGGAFWYHTFGLTEQDEALAAVSGLTGDATIVCACYNGTKAPRYLGYRLENDSGKDAFVTVQNIGWQTGAGRRHMAAWSQYENHLFQIPGQDQPDAAPRIFQPMTYRLPTGESLYVLGGTTADAYLSCSVDGTADNAIQPGEWVTGVVKFHVEGRLRGTLCSYADSSGAGALPAPQETAAAGTAWMESDITWTVNDRTPSGELPVKDGDDERSYWGTDGHGIEYHEHYTIRNDGEQPRMVTFKKESDEVLLSLCYDGAGELLDSRTLAAGDRDAYTVVILPHTEEHLTLCVLAIHGDSAVCHSATLT
ncbi:MAG: hypothetical protein IJU16_02770 [Clostridia bacterium]|nr:hypothetical protein [Clostridia bacterium]